MKSYNTDLQNDVKNMFVEINGKTNEIIQESPSFEEATKRIMEFISTKLTMECEGYIVDLYYDLTERVKNEDFFKDPDHLNKFYHLDLRGELNDKYHFEISTINAYKKGLNFKEINRIYAATGVAAGTLAIGCILKFAISGLVNIPFAVLVAGAIVTAFCTYYKVVPDKNMVGFQQAVRNFLNDLENEILNWLADIEEYFNARVRTLYLNY